MQFDSISAFLDMGGYGVYVWAVYIMAMIVIIYNFLEPTLMRKRLLKMQASQIRRDLALPSHKSDRRKA